MATTEPPYLGAVAPSYELWTASHATGKCAHGLRTDILCCDCIAEVADQKALACDADPLKLQALGEGDFWRRMAVKWRGMKRRD